jgi:fructose/tagatose bisphosphate aldolase
LTRAIVVHSLAHARAALAAASDLCVPVEIVSAEGAAGYAGPMWFLELVRAATENYPQVAVTAVLDCGAAPGHALAALRAGCPAIRLDATRAVRAKIAAIARQCGAVLHEGKAPPALDLLYERDPVAACRAWLAKPKKTRRR